MWCCGGRGSARGRFGWLFATAAQQPYWLSSKIVGPRPVLFDDGVGGDEEFSHRRSAGDLGCFAVGTDGWLKTDGRERR